MSQSFDLSGVTHVQLNGLDCPKLMLNGVRIWERYTATRQVWVTSGYNSSSWVTKSTAAGTRGTKPTWSHNTKVLWGSYWEAGVGGSPYTWQSGYSSRFINGSRVGGNNNGNTFTYGTWRLRRGAQSDYRKNKNGVRYHYYYSYLEQYVTTWVDTSAYETESYTAYYY